MAPEYTAETALDGLTVDGLRGLIAQLEEQPEWNSTLNARQTGYSLHVKWCDGEKHDVTSAITHAQVLEQTPALLYTAAHRLLALLEAKG